MVDKDLNDDVFAEDTEEMEEVEAEESTKEPEGLEDETGEEAEEESTEEEAEPEADAVPPTEEETEKEDLVPVGALKGERHKRQATQQKLDEAYKKLAEYEGSDLTEDQIKFKEDTDKIITASREIIKDFKDDYDEMEEIFIDLNDEDPYLGVKMRESKNPAKFVYDTAKKHLKTQEVGKITQSDDWKEFQEWKKSGKAKAESPTTKIKKAALGTPKLKQTSASKKTSDDDDLWS